MPTLPITTKIFSGGMNLFCDDSLLGETEYGLAFNVRNRTGALNTIKEPVEDEYKIDLGNGVIGSIPKVNFQGLFSFGGILLVFASGIPYYKTSDDPAALWIPLYAAKMDPDVDQIYVCAVPTPAAMYDRKLVDATVINGSVYRVVVKLTNEQVTYSQGLTVNGVKLGVVLQDGINQPKLIYIASDNSVKVHTFQRYSEWTLSYREYVPVGKQMAFMDGILFIANGSKIYRSVSGRWFDFVVNVEIDGNKGGDAETTAYSVAANDITCLTPLNSGQLFVGTVDGCFPLTLDYDSTIFQEPTFNNLNPIIAGIVNQQSIIDILSDYSFIDIDGIRSFNAIQQLQNEGRQSIMSTRVNRLLSGIPQLANATAAFVYDNYALFAVNTTFGYCTLIYDTLVKQWVGIDNYGLGAIKQFAVINAAINPRLWAITKTKIFQLYAGTTSLQASVRFRSFANDDISVESNLQGVRGVFSGNTEEDTTASAFEVVCNELNPVGVVRKLKVGNAQTERVQNVFFPFHLSSTTGYKVTAQIEWQSDAKLLAMQLDVNVKKQLTPDKQMSAAFASS